MRVLIDMDEVLVDFVGGLAHLFMLKRDAVRKKQRAGVWDITIPIGITNETMWTVINNKPLFWEVLEPLSWAKDVIKCVESITKDWYVVSDPGSSLKAYEQKTVWLRRFLGDEKFDRFVFTKHKYLLANQQTVLIDDSDTVVTKFCLAGGLGIVFPTKGGSTYRYAKEPVSYLKTQLKKMSNALEL